MTRYVAQIGSLQIAVELSPDSDAILDGTLIQMSNVWIDDSGKNLLLVMDGRSYDLRIEEENGSLVVTHAGNRYHCALVDERLAASKSPESSGRAPGRLSVKAPMPGLVVKVLVESGANVKRGDRLVVLEAMKMENDVKAARDGRILSVIVSPGQAVEGGRELLVIE